MLQNHRFKLPPIIFALLVAILLGIGFALNSWNSSTNVIISNLADKPLLKVRLVCEGEERQFDSIPAHTIRILRINAGPKSGVSFTFRDEEGKEHGDYLIGEYDGRESHTFSVTIDKSLNTTYRQIE